MACFRAISQSFFEYSTPHVILIQSKKIGIFNRLIQLVIIVYIIGCVLIYRKGYQEFSTIISSVTVKLKGTVLPNFTDDQLNLPHPEVYRRVWDIGDYGIPQQGENSFIVPTNVIVTPNQTQGICPEDIETVHSHCNASATDNAMCIPGQSVRSGNGIMTGKCVLAFNNITWVCEVKGWCPVEPNGLPLNGQKALLADSQDFTVFIKNSVEFTRFKIKRMNIPNESDISYLAHCYYSKDNDTFCPIFQIKTIVQEAGEDFQRVSIKGAVIAIIINWECNLDFDPNKHCFPTYEFRRLDDPDSKISNGWNFRYAHYYSGTQRTLFKIYGIKFVIIVQGTGGKFRLMPLLMNIGSGLGLLGITTVLCDILLLYLTKKKKYYQEMKFIQV